MEAAIATVDVPRGAIVIEVGCEGKWPRDFGEPPEEAFLQAVDYSLELMPQAPYGETVEMKLRTIVVDQRVTMYHMKCIEETNLLCIQPVHPGWQMASA